jgi:hypothetical protein
MEGATVIPPLAMWRSVGMALVVSLLVPSPGTAAQVAAAVKASTSIESIPSDLTPSLSSVSTSSGYWKAISTDYISNMCNAYNTPSLRTNPIPCFFGDYSSTKTVILYGDSNAANWAPAAALAATALRLRLALVAMPGCAPGFMNYSIYQVPFPKNCETWHNHLAPLARRLHPSAVLVVSEGFLNRPTPRGWSAAIAKAFEVLSGGNTKAKRIVVGTSPDFQVAVPQCLASNPTAVQTCDVNYSKSTSQYAKDLARDATVAATSGAKLMHTTKWLCSNYLCSPIVNDMLVYLDRDHFSIVYSQWLSGVFATALQSFGL